MQYLSPEFQELLKHNAIATLRGRSIFTMGNLGLITLEQLIKSHVNSHISEIAAELGQIVEPELSA